MLSTMTWDCDIRKEDLSLYKVTVVDFCVFFMRHEAARQRRKLRTRPARERPSTTLFAHQPAAWRWLEEIS